MKNIQVFFCFLATAILLSSCASASSIRTVAPANGTEECLLTPIQLKFVKMPREERRAYFADKECRKELASEGFYPRGVELVWETDKAADEYKVTLSTSADFAPGTCTEFTTKENSIKVDNLLIATKYFWKVKGGNAESAVTSFTTADVAPRLLRIPKLWNVRDIGGRIGLNGRRVKQNMAIRSAGLNNNADISYYSPEELKKDTEEIRKAKALTEKGHKVAKRDAQGNIVFKPGSINLNAEGRRFMLEVIGVKSDLDLRRDDECMGMTGSPLGDSVKWFHISFYQYGYLKSRTAQKAFADVFRVFLDEKNYPIDFHCIGGQDRTGTVAFLLNGLLGVPEDELYLDWEVTGYKNFSTGFRHETHFDKLIEVIDKYEGATINERIENFVLSIGFTKEDIQHFRDIMLE